MLRKYPNLFQDPHLDYPIHDMDLPFAEYITQSEKIIAKIRPDANPRIIQDNAPFELKPNAGTPKYGVLLIHGLLDSTFIMRDIGKALQADDALVRAILLPGHGTVPGALLHTRYTDWLQAVKYGVETLKRDVEKIFLVGFSTGASLALHHAAHDKHIAGLVLLAPAFKINSPFTFISKWMPRFHQNWFCRLDEIDPVKYQSVTFNAIDQVYQLGRLIQKMKTPCPLFMILSQDDKIICSKTAIHYFQQTTHPDNRALIYASHPTPFSDTRMDVRSSVYPDKNIFSFCHISLPVSSDNPHYGMQGDYVQASHLDKNIKYGALDKLDSRFYDFLKKIHVSRFEYERLTWNPDFQSMQDEMKQFIRLALAYSDEKICT
ncbi:MAG TPA: alpha/beta fold hydrolase [Gammaproteobacteria bacterium]|nr:alpha/beta fold hydrolase [Gammaproteobacteria bacterium]